MSLQASSRPWRDYDPTGRSVLLCKILLIETGTDLKYSIFNRKYSFALFLNHKMNPSIFCLCSCRAAGVNRLFIAVADCNQT